MATPAAGITATWDNVSFSEVVDLKVSLGGNLPISRQGDPPFSLDLGTIDVVCLGSQNCDASKYGKRAMFVISGAGSSFSHKAIFEKVTVDRKVNDVERYTVTLRLAPG